MLICVISVPFSRESEMMNPIAIAMMVSGALLLLFGVFLVMKCRKMLGTIISFLGLGAMSVPFVVSFLIATP